MKKITGGKLFILMYKFLFQRYITTTIWVINYDMITTIVNFFSYVAHVWVPGAKTTGPIVKMFVFS
jgi:hypothetical protein